MERASDPTCDADYSFDKLVGTDNYHAWTRNMRLLLRSQNLEAHIDVETAICTRYSDHMHGYWQSDGADPRSQEEAHTLREDRRARASIMKACTEEVKSEIALKITARSAWLDLESIYAGRNPGNLMIRHALLLEMRMQSHEELGTWVNRMQRKIADFEDFGGEMSDQTKTLLVLRGITKERQAGAENWVAMKSRVPKAEGQLPDSPVFPPFDTCVKHLHSYQRFIGLKPRKTFRSSALAPQSGDSASNQKLSRR